MVGWFTFCWSLRLLRLEIPLVQVLYLGHGQQSWCWSSNAMSAMSAMSIYSRCKCPDSAWVNSQFFLFKFQHITQKWYCFCCWSHHVRWLKNWCAHSSDPPMSWSGPVWFPDIGWWWWWWWWWWCDWLVKWL